jgi:hypothetical protein
MEIGIIDTSMRNKHGIEHKAPMEELLDKFRDSKTERRTNSSQ